MLDLRQSNLVKPDRRSGARVVIVYRPCGCIVIFILLFSMNCPNEGCNGRGRRDSVSACSIIGEDPPNFSNGRRISLSPADALSIPHPGFRANQRERNRVIQSMHNSNHSNQTNGDSVPLPGNVLLQGSTPGINKRHPLKHDETIEFINTVYNAEEGLPPVVESSTLPPVVESSTLRIDGGESLYVSRQCLLTADEEKNGDHSSQVSLSFIERFKAAKRVIFLFKIIKPELKTHDID